VVYRNPASGELIIQLHNDLDLFFVATGTGMLAQKITAGKVNAGSIFALNITALSAHAHLLPARA
jgi:hypothetical protein